MGNYKHFLHVKWGKLRFFPNHLLPGSKICLLPGGTEFPFSIFSCLQGRILSFTRQILYLFREQLSDLPPGGKHCWCQPLRARVQLADCELTALPTAQGPSFLLVYLHGAQWLCALLQRRLWSLLSGAAGSQLSWVNPIPALSILQNASNFLVHLD